MKTQKSQGEIIIGWPEINNIYIYSYNVPLIVYVINLNTIMELRSPIK